jgi:hypothetical protein
MKVSAKEAWLPPYLHDHMAGSVGLVRRRATGFRFLRTSAATPYSLQIRSQGNC